MSRNIFVDLDGTLVDVSRRDHVIFATIMIGSSFKSLPFEFYWSLRKAMESIEGILNMCGAPPEFAPHFLKNRADLDEDPKYLAHDTLIPGALETLQELRNRGHKVYVLTKRRDTIATMAQCKLLGITDVVDNIFVTEGQNKADILRREMKGVEDIMVGDTENDIRAAQEAHILSVGVLTGIRDEKALQAMDPDYLISDIKQLLSLIA